MRIKVSQSTRVYRRQHISGSNQEPNKDIIQAESEPSFDGVGTTFYPISAERLLKALDRSKKKLNKFFVDILRYTDLSALNLDSFYGSQIDEVNNIFYLCVTDGKPIEVNGEEVDPAEALDKYSIEDLSQYTKQPDDDIILKNISVYDLNQDVFDSDIIDTIVEENLQKGVHFKDIVVDYDDLKKILRIDV